MLVHGMLGAKTQFLLVKKLKVISSRAINADIV